MYLPKLPANLPSKPFIFQNLMTDESISLSKDAGNVILIVNTASRCGFANQFKDLEALYQKFKSQGFLIIAVPSNDFGNQEIDEQALANRLRNQDSVHFTTTKKYKVIGRKAHPFFQWANNQVGIIGCPKWNFHKYLINRQSQLINYFHSTTNPLDSRIIRSIEQSLHSL
ncbi:glutathione peroxidase [Gammaproteobacteria bacterium]|nr:glutathione peroxidase [Gammaproteobacteria bacterium]